LPAAQSHAPRQRTRQLGLVCIAVAVAASAWGLSRGLAWRAGLWPALGPRFAVLLIALAGSLALALCALVIELRGEPAGHARRLSPLSPLRRAWIVVVLAWIAMLIAVQPFQRLWLDFAAAIAAGVWSAWHLLALRTPRPPRWGLNAERVLAAACAVVVLLELGLRALALASPMPLLARGDDAPGRFVERFRCTPGEVRFGFACNERGFYDEPFARRGAGELCIASIGDSFNVGAVPHAWHYTSVCEERLGLRVDNIGVAGIGPPEYHHLLVEEALPLDPSAIVVSVFVGNDLDYAEPSAGPLRGHLRSWFDRQQVFVAVVPRRIARKRGERALGDVARIESSGGAPRAGADRASLLASLPWLADPMLEQPSLSPQAFLRLETSRARAVCAGEPPALRAACERLRQMRTACGPIPLGVLLIPDEFQVEDALWSAVTQAAGVPLDRDLAQRLLVEWLVAEGIPYVDLLPLLRDIPPLADGRRHVFHHSDTHFNARGNAAAGEALAQLVERLLRR
jgi:hypothetical protein